LKPEREDAEPTGLLRSLLVLKLRPLWPWLAIAAVTWIGWREIRLIQIGAARDLIRETRPELFLGLLALTAVNLAVAGLYDVAALGPRARPPGPATRWATGTLSFAWSNFLTVGPLAGPALRLWLYRRQGVDVDRGRSALTVIVSAFAAALTLWCLASTIPLPGALDTIAIRAGLGIAVAALLAAALRAARRFGRAPASLRAWDGSPALLAIVAAADWLLAWLVFHAAIQGFHGGVAPVTTLRAFFVGQLVGLVSLIPGGIGSADAYWLHSLASESGGHDRLVAALVVYRCAYYVLPWGFATLTLVGRLIRTGRRVRALLRTALASYAFLCGAVLLASAATPALSWRVAFLHRTVPLAVVEVSHGISVILGFLLLVVSRGLARGYRSSHRTAVALFLSAALATFLKGLDFEEAALALVAVAALLVFREPFHRKGRLEPSTEFLVSVGAFAVVLFATVGLGSYAELPAPGSILSRFGFHAQSERFVRGLIVLTVAALAVASRLAQRSRSAERLPDPEEVDRALGLVREHGHGTSALLVACGDKALFQCDRARGFIAYRTAGPYLVAYSDLVAPEEDRRDLLSAFVVHAADVDREVVLYQISPELLPLAHDFGFSFFKLGEEAIVDLAEFDLKGNKAKSWRSAVNGVERSGGSFEIVSGGALAAALPDLRRVSDAWLQSKQGSEKTFSLGRFDESYLLRFPCALVRDAGGRIVAFANVLEGPHAEEISVDLMRQTFDDGADGGIGDVMDYLLIRLMLHGKERGFARFNLGMAPLAAVGEERSARPLEKLAHLFFRHGDHWYNYRGLRRFKEKFDPRWEPRYMAYPRPWDWPLAIANTAVLISGGWRTVLMPKRSGA
jgi:phosphatidylglycerol lysyltransferase